MNKVIFYFCLLIICSCFKKPNETDHFKVDKDLAFKPKEPINVNLPTVYYGENTDYLFANEQFQDKEIPNELVYLGIYDDEVELDPTLYSLGSEILVPNDQNDELEFKEMRRINQKYFNYTIDIYDDPTFDTTSINEIEIIIDTKQLIYYKDHWCHLVWLINNSQDTVDIGLDGVLDLKTECYSSKTSKWIQKEHLALDYCHNGSTKMFLTPNSMAAAVLPKASCTEADSIRVNLYGNISNTIAAGAISEMSSENKYAIATSKHHSLGIIKNEYGEEYEVLTNFSTIKKAKVYSGISHIIFVGDTCNNYYRIDDFEGLPHSISKSGNALQYHRTNKSDTSILFDQIRPVICTPLGCFNLSQELPPVLEMHFQK